VHGVHLVTLSDHHGSERHVGLMQRDRRVGHHLAGQAGHPHKIDDQLI
jgi:hypothetical protein